MTNRNVEPTPPAKYLKMADHHWLEVLDYDGHSFGVVVLQWNPQAKRWSHSGMVGTSIYIDTSCYKYLQYCPVPEFN